MCHVGIDVGTNAVAPKILLERLGTPGDTLSQFEYAMRKKSRKRIRQLRPKVGAVVVAPHAG